MKPNLNAFDQKYNILNSVIYTMGDMPEGLEYKNNLFYDKKLKKYTEIVVKSDEKRLEKL